MSSYGLLAVLAGALAGFGIFGAVVAIRGLPVRPKIGPDLRTQLTGALGARAGIAIVAGLLVLLATRWIVAAIGVALLTYSWRSLGGAASERKAMTRLEALATWTESLRDTIAGAVGLEQAIPASTRVADPSIREPLTALVDRLHTRVPMHIALHRFADDLDDPSADMIIAALIINARLRGPGLRALLGALASSVREELDMRRKVSADRRSTRRSVQIVIGVSVGVAIALALVDHSFLAPYNGFSGQLMLALIGAIYAAGIIWLRRLATFESPQRLLGAGGGSGAAEPETVASWRTTSRNGAHSGGRAGVGGAT